MRPYSIWQRRYVLAFWISTLIALAMLDVVATSLPGDLSFSETVRVVSVYLPWLRVVYIGGAVFLYWHFWGRKP